MYRIIPLRTLRRTAGVIFDELAKSDIPKINGIDRVIHGPYSISPGPVSDAVIPCDRPWYMHKNQDDNLLVLSGTRYIDIFDPQKKEKASFIVTPDEIYKNEKLYYKGPAMLVWPAGIFHRIISGVEGSISINFASRDKKFNIDDNFHVYNLCTNTGDYHIVKEGTDDQPDLNYHYPSPEIENLVKKN
tara:strand:+ start:3978 stop:4541 length:564 start_codon:yes stop_codon:yes gene_type:complete